MNERNEDLVDSGRCRLKNAGSKIKQEQVSPTLISMVLDWVSKGQRQTNTCLEEDTYAHIPTLTMLYVISALLCKTKVIPSLTMLAIQALRA